MSVIFLEFLKVIKYYANKKEINIYSSAYLRNKLKDITLSKEDLKTLDNNNLEDIYDLYRLLELHIKKETREDNGIFFTPPDIVNYIIKNLHPKIKDRCIDFSSGNGAFLIGLFEYLKTNYNKHSREIISKNIFGCELMDYNVEASKILLALNALEKYNEVVYESDFNIICADVFSVYYQDFDVVVGNPPYIKSSELSKASKEVINLKNLECTKKSYNLYYAFIELGHKMLSSKGRMGFITPNRFFSANNAKDLRNYLYSNKSVREVVNFKSNIIFKDALTYSAIIFLDKNVNDTVLYCEIEDGMNYSDFLEKPKTMYENKASEAFGDNAWKLHKDGRDIVEKIESFTKISDLFKINSGIGTSKEEVFLIKGKQKNGYFEIKDGNNTYFIEKDITVPLFKVSLMNRNIETHIISPYNHNNGVELIRLDEMKEKYPKALEYLYSKKSELDKIKRNKDSLEFYEYGKNQNLGTSFGIKLITSCYSKSPNFLVVDEYESYFANGLGIFIDENSKYSSDIMQKILNSGIMRFYISNTARSIKGGFYAYTISNVKNFGICDLSPEDIGILKDLNDERDIDEFLSKKYKINLR